MYCHYVPQVYQKLWHSEKGKANVYYFNKTNLKFPIDKNGGNVGNNLGVEDLYILSTIDFYNGIDKNNHPKIIETEFDHKLENNYKDLLSKIEKLIKKAKSKENGLLIIDKENNYKLNTLNNKLLEYIIMQFLRIRGIFRNIELRYWSNLSDICQECYKEIYPNSQVFDLNNDEEFHDSIWKNTLLTSLNKKDISLTSLNAYKKALRNNGLIIQYNDNDCFILSDNPVLYNLDFDKKFKELPSGLFFPLSPNILVIVGHFEDILKPNNFIVSKLNIDYAKYINYLLKENASKYVGNNVDEIESKISSDYFNK